MSSDEPHTAWHPAFRPNSDSEADAIAAQQPRNGDDSHIAATPSSLPAYKSHPPKELDLRPKSPEDAAQDDAGMSNWFADDEPGSPPIVPDATPKADEAQDEVHESDATRLDVQEDKLDENVRVEEQPAEIPAADVSRDTSENAPHEMPQGDDIDDAAFNAPMTAVQAKHASTISFARTVSHDVTLAGEDEDSDWNIQRTDTDPFKFMPPNDRTNSFPPVPPLQQPSASQESHTASIPAQSDEPSLGQEQSGQEAEDDFWASEAQPSQIEDTPEEDGWASGNASQQFLGGDVQDATAEASEERFAEGLPLISDQSNGDVKDGNIDPLSENAGDDDDFFNQIGDEGQSQEQIPDPMIEQPLQRKSTAQVLSSLAPPATARKDTGLEDTLEEEEVAGEQWPTDIGGAEGAEAGDDFFSQVRDTTPEEAVEATPEAVEIQPTALNVPALPGTGLEHVHEAREAGEEEWPSDLGAVDEAKPQDAAQEPSAANGVATEAVDAEAKWAAFLGDDDDGGFLDDDSADTNAPAVDPSAFFGDDDEGFLEDIGVSAPSAAPVQPPTAQVQPASNPYLPSGLPQAPTSQPPANPYLPTAITTTAPVATTAFSAPSSMPPPNVSPSYGAFNPPPQPRPDQPRATSFADKARSGYSSPYDLPMEVAKPRKRQSMQQLPRASAATAPPPRSSSMQAPPPLVSTVSAGMTPPTSSHGPPTGKPVPPPLKKAAESFFEDLPISSRPRPSSRQSQKSAPTPQLSPYGPPSATHGPPQLSPLGQQVHPAPSPQYAPAHPQMPQQMHQQAQPAIPSPYAPTPQQTPVMPQQAPAPTSSQYAPAPTSQYAPVQPPAPSSQAAGQDLSNLVAPPRVGPYAPVHSNSLPPPSTLPATNSASKYSPTPGNAPPTSGVPPALSNRYSPAPGSTRAASAGAPPPVLPHQPRTSSPLAHFEVSHDVAPTQPPERRSSSALHGIQRIPSLPQVQEEDTSGQNTSFTGPPPPHAGQPPPRARQTPPPLNAYSQATLSPPKRVSGYAPHPASALSPPMHDFAPPQRSQTQSPGALHGRPVLKPIDPIQRPSSVNDPTSPRLAAPMMGTMPSLAPAPAPAPAAPVHKPSMRPRGFSQNLNFVTPTDGREQDQLQRWRGAPLISWGVGGTLITSFPKSVPRYNTNQSLPMILRSPGEVQVKNIREVDPLEERLAKFPGPLKGKSKKKETLAWLSTGIEGLEKELPNMSFQQTASHENTRAVERVLLWKILRLFVEYDGALEGSDAVNKAVREVLAPGLAGPGGFEAGAASAPTGFQAMSVPQMQSDGVDASTVEQIRKNLMMGDRERAVWDAADKRLWGHALLIASTTSPDLYKKVAQEFVRKEVNTPGHNNESLAVLYEVLSGNHEECVDELVPVHARAGLQLMNTTASANQTKDALAGLDKWQETLTLILSNRSADDVRALNSLGSLLSGYGRAEAAHVCFLFARNATIFGGLDNENSNFVLVGADHRRQADSFAKETEALLLSEVYEYGLSLAPASGSAVTSSPHLAAYKLQHALTLAEYGHRDKALAYCEALATAISSQTRRSPYHHAVLESAVEDLAKRLRQAPKEGGANSWITKPSMNKVSDSVWNRFNKFVAGDDEGGANTGSEGEGGPESGPFARLAGGTPTISRPPSAGGATGMEMFGPQSLPNPAMPMMNGGGIPPPATRAASRYAPTSGQVATPAANPYDPNAGYTPARSSMERSSGEYNRSSLDQPRKSSEMQNKYSPSFAPSNSGMSPGFPGSALGISQDLPPAMVSPHEQQQQPATAGYSPYAPHAPGMNGSAYTPFSQQPVEEPKAQVGPGEAEQPAQPGYEAPSYSGYEPPSYGYKVPPMDASAELSSFTPEASQPDAVESQSNRGGYEAPDTQSYGYEPPSYGSYVPDPEDNDDDAPKPKKKSFMDDDDDDIPALKNPAEKSKADKDRENAELFRKAAEEDAKRAEAEKAAKTKKGWGFGAWFGGSKAPAEGLDSAAPNKPIRAKLGEKSSFYFDPDLKRWVNKNGNPEDNVAKTATPPPPRSAPRSAAATPPPPSGMAPPMGPPMGMGKAGPPPPLNSSLSVPNLQAADGAGDLSKMAMGAGMPPPGGASMLRSASNTSAASAGGPPSRPATSMSNASSLDDLIGAAAPRKGGKKPRKSGRYVDVMANN